jgi:hypothetical protein
LREYDETTELAAPGGDELRVSEGLEDFGEETFGGVGSAREIGEEYALLFRNRGEVDENSDGVVGGACELHGGVGGGAFVGGQVFGGLQCHAFSRGAMQLDSSGPNSPIESRVMEGVTAECIGRHRPLFARMMLGPALVGVGLRDR